MNYEGTQQAMLEHLIIKKACTIYHFGGQSNSKVEKLVYTSPTTSWKAVINPPGTANGFGAYSLQVFIAV